MKKFLLLFIVAACLAPSVPAFAITIKKAAPVATKPAEKTDVGASLVPTVLSLVSNVQQLTQKQKELTEECIPTTQELTFVNNMVKEWAKTGASSAGEIERSMKIKRCQTPSGGYSTSVKIAAGSQDDVCYDYFGSDADKDMVWYQFPMATKATYCADGALTCDQKSQRTVSNIYDVFNLIDFSDADYGTESDVTMAAKLMAKMEQCSYAKINAKKRQMWQGFLTDTISGVGQKTNTGTIMQSVGGMSGQGLGGALQSLGGVATQFLNK